jgi:hypothetical protein
LRASWRWRSHRHGHRTKGRPSERIDFMIRPTRGRAAARNRTSEDRPASRPRSQGHPRAVDGRPEAEASCRLVSERRTSLGKIALSFCPTRDDVMVGLLEVKPCRSSMVAGWPLNPAQARHYTPRASPSSHGAHNQSRSGPATARLGDRLFVLGRTLCATDPDRSCSPPVVRVRSRRPALGQSELSLSSGRRDLSSTQNRSLRSPPGDWSGGEPSQR